MKSGLTINMTKRERWAVILAVCAVGLFLIFQFIITPYGNQKQTLQRQYEQAVKDLQEIRVLKTEYESLNKTLDLTKINFENRDRGFTLFSFLDKLSGETGIKANVSYMKPSSTDAKSGPYKLSQVEVKLKAITLKQLTDYLYGIETSKNTMFVRRLTIDRSTKPDGYIDVVLQVETYET
jgi:general secretion pathway protein M